MENKEIQTEKEVITLSLNYVRRITDNYSLTIEEARIRMPNYNIVE